jgi:predicted alpha/beta-hydrolase family hydrolase
VGALVLGHGAGGSVTAPDLQAVARAGTAAGLLVALVEQPYRVAGRRSAPPAPHLDEAWIAVLAQLRGDGPLRDLPVITGGRSSGARVACRTAAATGAAGVVCLAFPLQPPRRDPSRPRVTRLAELELPTVPVLVVQGVNDRFGMPPEGPGRTVAQVEGDHALRKGVTAIGDAVADWARGVL